MSAAAEAGKSPWLGLVPYSEADRGLFFGRDEETQDLLRLVRREVLTVLFGRSGSGKSSLLKAGLFPLLREERLLPVWLRLDHSGKISYGAQIRDGLTKALAEHGIEVEILSEPVAAGDGDFWEYLHRAVFWDARNQPVAPVLVFDQFEELFTIGKNEAAISDFLEQLADVVENRIPPRVRERVEAAGVKLPAGYEKRHYKVIVTLREDFVSRLDGLSRDMPSIMHNRYALAPMTGGQALEAVLKPGGALVTEEVARTIVRFVSAANDEHAAEEELELQRLTVEPAMLSLVCSELNLLRIDGGRETIALEQVRASGDQIIGNFYERSLEGMSGADRIFIEDRLVTASGFRTAVPVEDALAANLDKQEIAELIDRRLLHSEDRLGIPHIELSHDVLTKVVVRSRHFRREREESEARRRAEISEAEARERDARATVREKKARRARRARVIATAAAVIFATLAGLAIKGWLEADGQKTAAEKLSELAGKRREAAEAATLEANARSLALNAVDTSRRDPELALLLSIESSVLSFKEDGSKVAPREIELALRTAVRESLIRKRFTGHTSQVYSVAFDREGGRLVTGAAHLDGTARIWDTVTGREIARLDPSKIPGSDGRNTTISCARFSPDGKRLVTATYRDGGHIYVWDIGEPADPGSAGPPVISPLPGDFRGHTSGVTSIAFSPDGRLVASGGYDKVVRIWNPETREEIMPPLAGHALRIRRVVFSKDGRKILSASDDGTAALWDIGPALDAPGSPVGKRVFDAFPGRPKEDRDSLHAAALSPDDNWIATAGNDNYLRIWDARTGVQVAAEVHPDGVMAVAFIDDKRVVSACNDATIRFWEMVPTIGDAKDPDSHQPRFLRPTTSQRGHEGWIRDIAVSPDKRSIATAGNDGTVRQWALPQGGEIGVLGGYGRGFYRCAALQEIGGSVKAYCGTLAGNIIVKDAWTGEMLADWPRPDPDDPPGHDDTRAISLSPDGTRLVSAGGDQIATVRDTATGLPLFRWTGHLGEDGGTIYHARFSPDGKSVVTASNDGTAQVWNAADGSPGLILIPGAAAYTAEEIPVALASRISARADPVATFIWGGLTEAERTVLAASPADGDARIATLRTALNRLVNGPALAHNAAFPAVEIRRKTLLLGKRSPDAGFPNRFLLDDAFPGLLRPSRHPLYDARFSADGTKIVTADFNAQTATVWNASDGERLVVLRRTDGTRIGHNGAVVAAGFSPDGKWIATACMDGNCRIWNAGTGEVEATLPHNVAVRDVCYSPDGALILTAAVDGIARIWDVRTCLLRSELRGHTDTIPDASFSASGHYIVTTSRDGTVRICYTKPWDLYSLANLRVTRKLTIKERDQFGVTRKLDAKEVEYYRTHPEDSGEATPKKSPGR